MSGDPHAMGHTGRSAVPRALAPFVERASRLFPEVLLALGSPQLGEDFHLPPYNDSFCVIEETGGYKLIQVVLARKGACSESALLPLRRHLQDADKSNANFVASSVACAAVPALHRAPGRRSTASFGRNQVSDRGQEPFDREGYGLQEKLQAPKRGMDGETDIKLVSEEVRRHEPSFHVQDAVTEGDETDLAQHALERAQVNWETPVRHFPSRQPSEGLDKEERPEARAERCLGHVEHAQEWSAGRILEPVLERQVASTEERRPSDVAYSRRKARGVRERFAEPQSPRSPGSHNPWRT